MLMLKCLFSNIFFSFGRHKNTYLKGFFFFFTNCKIIIKAIKKKLYMQFVNLAVVGISCQNVCKLSAIFN